ncbi:hypothetical protein WA026_015170 [Henosepilachna vigintioctopunctata]|uniref:Uncharacterized protein n=1 Tax=Henosepilachna vigintioctopunctata TaxID=420089 RepID=A0AAW1TU30_9CUCU
MLIMKIIHDSLIAFNNYTFLIQVRVSQDENVQIKKGEGVGIYVKKYVFKNIYNCMSIGRFCCQLDLGGLSEGELVSGLQLLVRINRPENSSFEENRNIINMLQDVSNLPVITAIFEI